MNNFYLSEQKALRGGWVAYRNGNFFAGNFPDRDLLASWIHGFCELNGIKNYKIVVSL